MNLTQISSIDLRQIGKLIETKERLLAEVAEIDRELTKFESGEPSYPTNAIPGYQLNGTRVPRGALKARIVDLVKSAGTSGITVKDLAGTLGVKAGNIYVWFNTTGRKVKEIKKVGLAKYSWVST